MHKKYNTNQSGDKSYYNQLKYKVNHMTKYLKRNYCQRVADEKNPKSIWQLVDTLTCSSKKKSNNALQSWANLNAIETWLHLRKLSTKPFNLLVVTNHNTPPWAIKSLRCLPNTSLVYRISKSAWWEQKYVKPQDLMVYLTGYCKTLL